MADRSDMNAKEIHGVEAEEFEITGDAFSNEPVRHGEWLVTSWRSKCSLCGFAGSIYDQPVNPFKYCPHCGAIMDGGENAEKDES